MEITLEFATRIKKFDKIFNGKKSKIVYLPDNVSISELLKKEEILGNYIAIVKATHEFGIYSH